MRRLTILLFSTVLLLGCGTGVYHKQLVAVDSLIAADLDDSACHMMEDIDITDIKAESDIAYYNMLAYELVFRSGKIPENDSMIDHSISHYKETDNKRMLARSYYYKGRILAKRDSLKAAVEYLKDAEEMASDTDDNLLMCKILGSLASMSISGGESEYAIGTALRAVEFAERAGDKEHLLYFLNTLSVAYGRIGKDDSSVYYMEKYIPLIKYAPKKDQAVFWANLSGDYERIGTEKAKEYIFRSLDILPLSSTYRALALIYLAEGNGAAAEESWRKGLKICDNLHTRLNMLNDMREYKQSIGRTEEATELADSVFILQTQLRKKWNEAKVKDVQVQKDADAKREKANKDKQITIGAGCLIIVGLVIIIAIIIIAYRGYRKRTRRKIEEQQDKIKDKEKAVEGYAKKIVKLETKAEERKRTAESLRKSMKTLEERQRKEQEKLQQTIAGNMAKGHLLYEGIAAGGVLSQWDKEQRDLFIEYYKTIRPDLYIPQELTRNQTIYILLADMGKSEEETMRIMGMSEGALRTMKSRMNTSITPDSPQK